MIQGDICCYLCIDNDAKLAQVVPSRFLVVTGGAN